MKLITFIAFLLFPFFIYSQVNEITFNHQNINFSAAPRSTLSPMSIKMWDNYNNGGPTTYGTVLEFYGLVNHQTGQLYFGGWDNSKIRYREAFYAQNTWSDWMTLLDSKNDVESVGRLKISGIGNHYILNGNVGIGTNNPNNKLQIGSNTFFSGNDLVICNNNGALAIYNDQSNTFLYGTNDISIRPGNGVLALYAKSNGNVLIGKTTQSTTGTRYKLDVEGPIRAHEIVVNTTGADFVFNPSYKLRSLSELETFIRTNKHLPDIAPAKEMQENGVSAGEMQAKLLQKVEELTLYVIELEKKIKDLEPKTNSK